MFKRTIYLTCFSVMLGLAGSVPAYAQADAQIPSTGSRGPVIDGLRDAIWTVSKEHELTQAIVGSPPAGFSASWWGVWDRLNLYVFVDINDSKIVTDNASSWQDDSVEIYFDGGNKKQTTAARRTTSIA